jgi:hypothetical protein
LPTSDIKFSEPEIHANQPVLQGGLIDAWKKYVVSLEKHNARLFSIVSNLLPQLEEGHIISLKLKSTIQEGELLKEKGNVLLFLRNELKNNTLEIRMSVVDDPVGTPTKAYTAADKLQVMIEKNPALGLLKQQFNLDLD